jgi:Prolyl-tRNA synthetase
VLLRMSTLFLRTLRENPAEAEVPSHALLVRAGFIRRVGPGGYAWLPLGKRVLDKITTIVREEMAAVGAQEVHLPALVPAQAYERSGRWFADRDEIFRVRGRLPARPGPRRAGRAARQGAVRVPQGLPGHPLPAPDRLPG